MKNDEEFENDLSYFMRMFPAAIPVVYNHSEHTLADQLKEVYKETFFVVYYPIYSFEQEKSRFFLILIDGSENFKHYLEGYFDRIGIRNREKIKCFGKAELLMKRDDSKVFGEYKDAISLAFKKSNPFEDKKIHVVSYLYNNQKLIKLENMFVPNSKFWFVENNER